MGKARKSLPTLVSETNSELVELFIFAYDNTEALVHEQASKGSGLRNTQYFNLQESSLNKYTSNPFDVIGVCQRVNGSSFHLLHNNIPQTPFVGEKAMYAGNEDNSTVQKLVDFSLIISLPICETDAKIDHCLV
jgi:hypothetical protein